MTPRGRGTQLARDLHELLQRMEAVFERSSRDGERLRRRLELELLAVLNGTGRFDLVPEFVPRSTGLTRQIEQRLARAENHSLARAIYENAYYDQSIDAQIARGAVHRSEWAIVQRLTRSLNVAPETGQDKLEDPPPWMIDVDEAHQDLRVWIRELALQDMLLAGLETFLVPAGSGRPSTEIYGIAFGSHRISPERRRRPPAASLADLNVERICIQHRAIGSPSEVFTDLRSEATQLAMGEELFPYWHLLGDFHTHAYRNLDDLLTRRGWNYSQYDQKMNIEWCARLRRIGHRPRVALILALCRAGRQTRRSEECWNGLPYVLRTTIGKCHCFISAYRIRPDGRYTSEGLVLKCPHLVGR